MPMTVDDLLEARDRLIAARASGALVYVDQNGERVEYKTDGQMHAALAFLNAEITRLSGQAPARVIHFKTSKGLT